MMVLLRLFIIIITNHGHRKAVMTEIHRMIRISLSRDCDRNCEYSIGLLIHSHKSFVILSFPFLIKSSIEISVVNKRVCR